MDKKVFIALSLGKVILGAIVLILFSKLFVRKTFLKFLQIKCERNWNHQNLIKQNEVFIDYRFMQLGFYSNGTADRSSAVPGIEVDMF